MNKRIAIIGLLLLVGGTSACTTVAVEDDNSAAKQEIVAKVTEIANRHFIEYCTQLSDEPRQIPGLSGTGKSEREICREGGPIGNTWGSSVAVAEFKMYCNSLEPDLYYFCKDSAVEYTKSLIGREVSRWD